MHFVSLFLADVPVVPVLLGGSALLLVFAGSCVAVAVGVFGFLKRKRNREQLPPADQQDQDGHEP